MSFSNALLCCSYSWPKLDHTVANCLVFTWTPCRMLDYLSSSNALWAGDVKSLSHQDLLYKWLNNWTTKELELHLFRGQAVREHIAALWKVTTECQGTFSTGNLPRFAFKVFFFNTHVVDRSSLPWIKALVSVGFLHHSITSKVAAAVRALV